MGILGIIIGVVLAIVLGKNFHLQTLKDKLIFVLAFPLGFDLIWFGIQCLKFNGNMYFVGGGCAFAFIASIAYIITGFFSFKIEKAEEPEEENPSENNSKPAE